MKWLTPILPYLAVAVGLFWVRHAFLALLGFHLAIILSLSLARSSIPLSLLFKSRDARRVLLSVLLCGSSGILLYILLSYSGVIGDLQEHVQALRLTGSTWPVFITYFVLVNPWIEEYFWRGYLGSPTTGLYPSDFLYSGFHTLILWGKVQPVLIVYSLIVLVAAGWFWRQLARIDEGLLAPVLGHMAADLAILLAVYQMSV